MAVLTIFRSDATGPVTTDVAHADHAYVNATTHRGTCNFVIEKDGVAPSKWGDKGSVRLSGVVIKVANPAPQPTSTDDEIKAWISTNIAKVGRKPKLKGHMKQVHRIGQMAVHGIVKVDPYIYCDSNDIATPGAKVAIKSDIWLCTGVRTSWGKITVKYIPRCDVNVEEGTITNGGVPVEADNIAATIKQIGEALNRWRGEEIAKKKEIP